MFVELKIEEKKLSNFFFVVSVTVCEGWLLGPSRARSVHLMFAPQIESRAAPAVSAAMLRTVPKEAPDSSWTVIYYHSAYLWSTGSFLALKTFMPERTYML